MMGYGKIFWLLFHLVILTLLKNSRAGNVNTDYYVDLIKESIIETQRYEFAKNAHEFKPKDDTIQDYGDFDFVIIGAGVTGSVLANRLSEISNWRILVIEAGDYSDGGFTKIPNLLRQHKSSKYNWEYPSVQQKNFCLGNRDKKCDISRGKGVGGGSLTNELVYCRGPAADYDRLAEKINVSSWRFDNLLPYFKKTEHFVWNNKEAPIETSHHAEGGLLQNEHSPPYKTFSEPFLQANKEMGYDLIDYNTGHMLGAAYLQRFTKNGVRQDFGSTFITPFLGRPSLEVTENSYVTKIEINPSTKVAESVLFTKNGQTYRVKASKEVILSAGSIASPQILMLSGVGPKEHLTELNIPVLEDLPVGDNYKDTVIVALPFLGNFHFKQPSLSDQVREYLRGEGLLTTPPSLPQIVGFYQLNKTDSTVPDIELFHLVVQDMKMLLEDKPKESNKTLVIFGAEYFPTKSIGTVRLNTTDPFDYPLIDPNGFSDELNQDLEGLYQSVQFILNLTQSKPYEQYQLKQINIPVPACADIEDKRDRWHCVLKQNAIPGLHMVGTCAIGTVVDSDLKVFGVNNLRVVDCSVLPDNIAGHSTIPCATIGEKLADVIKQDYQQKVYDN